MKAYSWGVFFEDGNRASFYLPFGPEHPDNLLYDKDNPWMKKVLKLYPTFFSTMDEMDLPLAFIHVNPPEEVAEDYFPKDLLERIAECQITLPN